MTSPYAAVRCLVELPGEDYGFNVWAYGSSDSPDRVLAAGYFQSLASNMKDGDILVVNCVRKAAGGRRAPPGRKMVLMVHKDRDGIVSTTKLLDLPHDPAALAAVLRGLTPAMARTAAAGAEPESAAPAPAAPGEPPAIEMPPDAAGDPPTVETPAAVPTRRADLMGQRLRTIRGV